MTRELLRERKPRIKYMKTSPTVTTVKKLLVLTGQTKMRMVKNLSATPSENVSVDAQVDVQADARELTAAAMSRDVTLVTSIARPFGSHVGKEARNSQDRQRNIQLEF